MCRALLVVAMSAALLLPVAVTTTVAEDERPSGWMGVTLGAVERPPAAEGEEPDLAAAPGPPLAGARVVGVVVDSPADAAGLRASDVVTQVDGREIASPGDLVRLVRDRAPGEQVELLVVRKDGSRRRVSMRLGERPEKLLRTELKRGWIGIEPLDVPEGLRRWWGRSEDEGVLLGDVLEGGPAWRVGLRPGDLLLTLDGRPVTGAQELARTIRAGGVGNAITLEVSRQGSIFEAEVVIEREPTP